MKAYQMNRDKFASARKWCDKRDIAFDIWFVGQIFPGSTSGFPLFSPFTVEIFRFQGLDWLYLEILAIIIVGIIAILDRKISIKNHIEK